MTSRLEAVAHVDLMFGGVEQPGFVDGHIGAGRNFLAVEDDHQTRHARDAGDRETALGDA